ncbi:MAG: hypothetical protein CM15mP102_01990 [Flavobacteriales bacterium]|nr:MAG: hypothetical protein CM15mP102_01990 [Flavobacteriales bacterium]
MANYYFGEGAEAMKYRFNWNFPIAFSKHDSSKLYTYSNHVHYQLTRDIAGKQLVQI